MGGQAAQVAISAREATRRHGRPPDSRTSPEAREIGALRLPAGRCRVPLDVAEEGELINGVAIPLIFENGPRGALTLYPRDKGAFDPSEIPLLEQLAADIVHGVNERRAGRARDEATAEVRRLVDCMLLARTKQMNRLLAGLALGLVLLAVMLAAWPRLTHALPEPRAPNVFGSTALRVGDTPLDKNWARVAQARPPPTAAVLALERRLRGQTTLAQMQAVNAWVNHAMRYKAPAPGAQHWATLAESLRRGKGDCTDYATGKLALLRALGVPAHDLYLLIVRDLVRRADHALLAVELDGRFWILDSGADEILPEQDLKDYRPILTFTAGRTWLHGYRRITVASAESQTASH